MKIKKILIRIGVILVLLSAYGLYKKYTFNKPEILFETQLTKPGVTEEFEVSVRRPGYSIGLAVNGRPRWFGGLMDGNYSIEYYKNGKFDRKESINQKSISSYYKDLYSISGSSGISSWKQMTLGQLKEPGRYTIKITVLKPEFSLRDYQGQLYFFADKPDKKDFAYMHTSEYKERNRKDNLFRNIIDGRETNQTLIPLRSALDDNDAETVKKIIKDDNNITVNTNMLFNRRVLDHAAFHNNVELVEFFIGQGADLYHKDELGKNALTYAIENNATKTVQLLLDHNMSFGDVDFVQQYLPTYSIDWGWQNSKSNTMLPLPYAVSIGSYELTKLMLENGERRQNGPTVNNAYKYMYDIPNFRRILPLLERSNIHKNRWRRNDSDVERWLERCVKQTSGECKSVVSRSQWEANPRESYYALLQEGKKLAEKQVYEKLLDNISDKYTSIPINGYKLPPRPDMIINDTTLSGIDSNENGIRDDIERAIYATFNLQIRRDIAMQMAKAQQAILIDSDPIQNADKLEQMIIRADACKLYLSHEYHLYDTRAFRTSMPDKYIFNTIERSQLHWEWKNALTPQYPRIPTPLIQEMSCDFNITKSLVADNLM